LSTEERKRVTGRQVLDYLVKNKYIAVATNSDGVYEKKSFESAYRNTRRWLQEFGGYKRGRRKNIVTSPEQTAKVHKYLRLFFDNRVLPPEEQLREVYTDKSYIHEHYNQNDDSIGDPNDEQDVQYGKGKHKGRRYCFAHAMQGANPRVAVQVLQEDKASLVPGAEWTFCPQKKGDRQGDYHKVFNGENFVAWF